MASDAVVEEEEEEKKECVIASPSFNNHQQQPQQPNSKHYNTCTLAAIDVSAVATGATVVDVSTSKTTATTTTNTNTNTTTITTATQTWNDIVVVVDDDDVKCCAALTSSVFTKCECYNLSSLSSSILNNKNNTATTTKNIETDVLGLLQTYKEIERFCTSSNKKHEAHSPVVTTTVNHLSSLSSYHQNIELSSKHLRMTANNNADLYQQKKASDADEDGRRKVAIHHQQKAVNHSHRMTHQVNVSQHNNNENIMNLRNRPLKAATAGTYSNSIPPTNNTTTNINQNISNINSTNIDVPTQSATLTKNNNSSFVRRRSNRHRHQQQSPLSADSRCQDRSSSPSKQEQQKQTSLPASSSTTRSIRSFFPLRTIGAVCELFRSQLDPGQFATSSSDDSDPILTTRREDSNFEPDLALLSIVIGIIETSLTRGLYEEDCMNNDTTATTTTTTPKTNLPNKFTESDETSASTTTNEDLKKSISNNDDCHHSTPQQNSAGSYSPAEATPAPIVAVSNVIHTPLDIPIPTVFYENVESLLKKFTTHIKESIDLSKHTNLKKTTREIIKKISEVIWSNLHRSHYKDRAHLQTIYNYITENKLDCYGVAYTVLAACQILGLDDVCLVMSEDHAWVIFGEGETCEVTWHGKCGNDDRCGQPIPENINCWLYLNGNTMTCDRFLTVATLVSAMNLSINATQDSEELAILQQQLLWILYEYGYLQKYPMALGNLGDLEDVCVHGISKKHPLELFNEAIDSAKKYYNDYHVYPYTYIGGYYFRTRRYKEAFKSWADAAQVIKKYNYTRDDEEIYKEFQEIANDLIPYIVKNSSSNNETSVLQDPECFVHLLRFYDGLCAWEEDSPTPVLHIGWTKPIVSTISKFPYSTRSQVAIRVNHYLNEKNHSCASENENDDDYENNNATRERRRRRAASIGSSTVTASTINTIPFGKICDNFTNTNKEKLENDNKEQNAVSFNNDESQHIDKSNDKIVKKAKTINKNNTSQDSSLPHNQSNHNEGFDINEDDNKSKSVLAILSSKKFSGIKNLLTADKLNTSAIQLQLTAQSQVNINKRNRNVNAKSSGLFSELDFVTTTITTGMVRTNTGNNSSGSNNKRFRRDI